MPYGCVQDSRAYPSRQGLRENSRNTPNFMKMGVFRLLTHLSRRCMRENLTRTLHNLPSSILYRPSFIIALMSRKLTMSSPKEKVP